MIVHDDADLVVVDKPAGMVVHPAAGHADGTLVNALLHHVRDLSGIGGELRPGIVHRLDRGTSGCNGRGQARSGARRAGAAVRGPRGGEGIRRPGLGPGAAGTPHRPAARPRPGRPQAHVGPVAPGARGGHAGGDGRSRSTGSRSSEVAIATGRTHQIRVHLSRRRASRGRRFPLRRTPAASAAAPAGGAATGPPLPPRGAAGVHAPAGRPADRDGGMRAAERSGAPRRTPSGPSRSEAGRRPATSLAPLPLEPEEQPNEANEQATRARQPRRPPGARLPNACRTAYGCRTGARRRWTSSDTRRR